MRITEKTSGMVMTNSYLLEENGHIYLIDTPDGNEEMAELIKEKGRLDGILLTHGHFDHVMGLKNILTLFPSTAVYLDKNDHDMLCEGNRKYLTLFGIPLSLYDIPDNINLLDYPGKIGGIEVIRTPGHTPGSVSLYIKDEGILFSGDTLFSMGEGRTDLGGNYSLLIKSLSLLCSLPGETKVLPGHGGYTTIREEKNRLF